MGRAQWLAEWFWYGVIIDGRKDRRFTVLDARIHIRAKLKQLFFHIGEESLV
jgi:hypothetical protein